MKVVEVVAAGGKRIDVESMLLEELTNTRRKGNVRGHNVRGGDPFGFLRRCRGYREQ